MICPICHTEHTESLAEALAQLANTPRELAQLVFSVSLERADARPAPGKWSAKEIVCHLADGELVYGIRYRKILAEPGSALVGFDQDAWAEHLNYAGQGLKNAMANFGVLRVAHMALLASVQDKLWDNSGEHAEYGTLTLRQLVVHLATHDRKHIAQVARLCAGGTKKTNHQDTKTPRKPS